MTIRKLLNYWFKEKRTGFYLTLAFISAGIYLVGVLTESSVSGRFPLALRKGGFFSFLALVLLFFIHLNLHSCHWFLEHFKDTDHLPKSQIAHVNSFCMTLFLTLSLVILPLTAYALEPVWQWIRQWFAGRVQPEDAIYPALHMDAEPMNTPNLAELLGDVKPTPVWMEKLDELVRILAGVLLVILMLLAIRGLCRRVWAFITKPRQFDDDEKIYLTPAWSLLSGEKSKTHRTSLFRPRSYNDRIRRQYRREILIHLRKKKLSPSPYASPQELEETAGLTHPVLHQIYEKARYGNRKCTKEDWEMVSSGKEVL